MKRILPMILLTLMAVSVWPRISHAAVDNVANLKTVTMGLDRGVGSFNNVAYVTDENSSSYAEFSHTFSDGPLTLTVEVDLGRVYPVQGVSLDTSATSSVQYAQGSTGINYWDGTKWVTASPPFETSRVRVVRGFTANTTSTGIRVNELTIMAETEQVPGNPYGMSASVTPQGEATITWNPPLSGGTLEYYRVYADGVVVYTTPDAVTLTYTHQLTTYDPVSFYVEAVGPGGTGVSDSVELVRMDIPPVTGLAVSNVTESGATITWDPYPGAWYYSLYLDTWYLTDVSDPVYVLTGLDAGTTYTFEVEVWTETQYSAPIPLTFTTASTAPPPAPSGLTATVGVEQVTLTWPAVPGATGYRVYRNGTLAGTTGELSYVSTGLPGGEAQTFGVSSYNAAGESPQATTSATPAAFVPSANLWRFDFLSGLSAAVSQTLGSLAPLFWIVGGLIVAGGMVSLGIQWLRRGF